jgi:hypothetical protein
VYVSFKKISACRIALYEILRGMTASHFIGAALIDKFEGIFIKGQIDVINPM